MQARRLARRLCALGLIVVLGMLCCAQVEATEAQNRKQRSLFMQSHPCPANGHIRGKCPGYVIVHATPLCAGGADRWSNMQWRTPEEAKRLEGDEQKQCEEFKRLIEGKGAR